MLFGKQKSQASGPSTIMKLSSLREQRTGQPDLVHRKASRGTPTPSPSLGTLTGKAEVQETGLSCQCWTPSPSPVPGFFWRALMHAHCLHWTEAIFKNYSKFWPLFTLPNGSIHCSIWRVNDSHPWTSPMACWLLFLRPHLKCTHWSYSRVGEITSSPTSQRFQSLTNFHYGATPPQASPNWNVQQFWKQKEFVASLKRGFS